MKTPEGVFPPKRNVQKDPARRYFLRKGMLDNNEDSRRSISSEEECSEKEDPSRQGISSEEECSTDLKLDTHVSIIIALVWNSRSI